MYRMTLKPGEVVTSTHGWRVRITEIQQDLFDWRHDVVYGETMRPADLFRPHSFKVGPIGQ